MGPEAGSDVFEIAVAVVAVEALVGGGLFQGAQVLDVGADLDVVEVILVDGRGDDGAATVPSYAQLGIFLVDVLCQLVDTFRITVATHEGDAGEVLAVFLNEVVDGVRVQRQAYVLPKVMAVTPRTVTRAIRNVNCQCHFVGYLLKYNIRVDVLQHRLICHSVITTGGLLLTGLREVRDALQVADDTSHVVHVLRVAVRALLQITLVNMAAVVADGVRDIEGEIVAAFLGCDLQQMQVLILGEMLLEVHVEGRATREVLDVGSAMQLELVEDGQRVVLYDIEVRVVAVAWYEVAVLTIPLGVLYTNVLGRNHLAVEHHVLRAILTIILFYQSEIGRAHV